MATLPDVDNTQKDAGAIEVEKVASLDVSSAPKDLNENLSEEEKKLVRRAT